MKWISVKLSEICEPKQWKSLPVSVFNEGEYLVYGANGIIGKYSEYNHEKSTIAITCRGATCGTLNITKPKSYITSNAMSLDNLNVNVDLKFIYYSLKKRGFKDVVSGTAQPQITGDSIKKIVLNIPESKSEQIRIANILSKAEELISERKQSIKLLDDYLKSVFLEMFGDPVKNEKGWEMKKINDLVRKEKYSIKRGPFGGSLKKEIFVSDGYLVYEQHHALNNDFTFGRYYIDETKFNELKAFEVKPGDIIISCSGVYLGKLAIIPPYAKKGIINQALLKLTLSASITNNIFFKFVFTHEKFKNKYLNDNRGSGIPNLPPMDEFKKIKFIYPPIELQNKFAKMVEKTEQIKADYKQSLQELENLYGSLSKKAFGG